MTPSIGLGLLLREPVAGRSSEYGEHPGVLRDPGLVGFASDRGRHVGGEPQDFGRGLGLTCHEGNDSTRASECVLVSALSDKAPRGLLQPGRPTQGRQSL